MLNSKFSTNLIIIWRLLKIEIIIQVIILINFEEELAKTVEKDIYLIGATAVEDKLQDKVPQTIADLIRASILYNVIFTKK